MSWYCSDPIEPKKILIESLEKFLEWLKTLIEITNEKCSSEKIPNECKKKQEAEEAKKAENAEEVKEAEDTKEVQKLNNNAAVCQDTEENNSAEQVLNEKNACFMLCCFWRSYSR